jgi:hypothetical protein
MKVRVIATLVTAMCLAASMASAQSIGVYFNQTAQACSGNIPNGTPFTLYILGLLGGPSAGGFQSAEFRVDGMPAGWFATPTQNPAANIVLGNPFTGGTNIAFPVCQFGSGGIVLLFTVNGFATSAVGETYLTVKEHSTTPSNPDPGFGTGPCPVQVLCNDPNFTIIEAAGGTAIINGGPCNVAVTPSSWSKVKGLYEN